MISTSPAISSQTPDATVDDGLVCHGTSPASPAAAYSSTATMTASRPQITRGIRPRTRSSAPAFGVTSNCRSRRVTSHHRQEMPTGTRKIRSANAVGQCMWPRNKRFAPQSRIANITAKTLRNTSGGAVEVWAPLTRIAAGTTKANAVPTPSSHQSVPLRYS